MWSFWFQRYTISIYVDMIWLIILLIQKMCFPVILGNVSCIRVWKIRDLWKYTCRAFVVKVTQNWSLWKRSIWGPNGVVRRPNFDWFSSLSIRHFSGPEQEGSAPEFAQEEKRKTYFWAEICSNFMRDSFTINIDHVSE